MKNNIAQGGISRRRMRMVQFALLAVAADIGFVCVELAIGMNPLTDIAQRPFLYLYLFLGTIVVFGVFGAMIGSREDLLEEMALRDSLTGLFNARYLQMRLQEELAAAKRHRTPVSLVLFDIDHFKRVNDNHGHPVGDRMLRLIGRTILSKLREGETVARVGGEEFALLLPHTSAKNAAMGAERICQAIGQTPLETDSGGKLAVTVSAGLACTTDHATHSAETIYRLADQALYQAKEQGRNRVVIGRQGASG
jgi:diguanylate cyclase (GGDEF)-like protein